MRLDVIFHNHSRLGIGVEPVGELGCNIEPRLPGPASQIGFRVFLDKLIMAQQVHHEGIGDIRAINFTECRIDVDHEWVRDRLDFDLLVERSRLVFGHEPHESDAALNRMFKSGIIGKVCP